MSVAELKIELTKELLNSNNAGLIRHIKALFATQETDWWDELPDEVKASAQRAIKQADRGELKSHKEVMSKYKKWQRK